MHNPIDPTLAQKGLNYAQIASTLVKRALDELTPLKQAAEKAASEKEPLLNALLNSGCIGEHQKAGADDLLQTHSGTMSLLKLASDHIQTLVANQKEAGDLGVGVDPAVVTGAVKASHDSLTSPFVGRPTAEKKASDIAYEAAMLGN